MSTEYLTYHTQPFGDAADLHVAPKPVDVKVMVVFGKPTDGEFSLDDLEETVLSAESSTLNDDEASFVGVMTEPPEVAGRRATLTVRWGEKANILGKLLIERLA